MLNTYLFTSESVTEGHPDKVCDQISDAIVDNILSQDINSRVAMESVVSSGLVFLTGEITSRAQVDYQSIARQVVREIGYCGKNGTGFDGDNLAVLVCVNKQSSDIASAVDTAFEVRDKSLKNTDNLDDLGAGDQGMMFGYACNETSEFMPAPIACANMLARQLSKVRKSGLLPYLGPDGKTQVTVEYENQKPKRIHSIVISTQHDECVNNETDNDKIQKIIEADLKEHVIDPIFSDFSLKLDRYTKIHINPAGRFVIGGPRADSGLTGRKIIVDTYGGYARHGGGAYSGKDPTKVDRSASYAARYVAKNIVAAKLATHCEVQVAYAIGVARPVSLNVSTFGTGSISDESIKDLVDKTFDLRPKAIIEKFKLNQLPQLNNGRFYQNLAAYGHFGRNDLNLPWEELDQVDALNSHLGKLSKVN